MDVLPSGGIFKELQLVHDTGYFSSACSLEERWQQVSRTEPHQPLATCIRTAFLQRYVSIDVCVYYVLPQGKKYCNLRCGK
ncbi:Krueppel-like factor 6 [Macrobrachium nipponense]|uniref:Krueppel-like factor 6 n=1 Tax=Macrobrachium nipponense TaxID=159736 RepID=UPI0030C8D05F